MKPLEYKDIKSGMELWDNDRKVVQKVKRVFLWAAILEVYPNRFFTLGSQEEQRAKQT